MTEREAPRSVLTSPSAAGGHYGAGAPHLGSNITPAADNRTTLARAAVAYARRGWPVFPLHWPDDGRCSCGNPECGRNTGKHPIGPLVPHGYKDASADLEQVAGWWRRMPHANIGLVPGRVQLPDGETLMVIDVDGVTGRENAEALDVPDDTAAVSTGRPEGGEHRYFRVPSSVNLSSAPLAEGLDVRHKRGSVILPPSVHRTGVVYSWLRPPKPDAIRRLPEHLLERLTVKRAVVRAPLPFFPAGAAAWRRVEAYLSRVPRGLADGGGRKRTAFTLSIFMLYDAGLSESDTGDVLAAWNQENDEPLSEYDLTRILRAAVNQGGRRAS